MRRPPGIVVLAIVLLGVALAVSAWRRGCRPEAAPLAEERSPPPASAPLAAAPPPSPPEAPVPPERTPPTGPASTAAPTTDDQLLVGIRANVRSDPRQAESLARQARERFPSSPHAEEWDALLVDALVNQQRIGAARSETYYYYDHHPAGAFTAHLFTLTGVHPTPVGSGPH